MIETDKKIRMQVDHRPPSWISAKRGDFSTAWARKVKFDRGLENVNLNKKNWRKLTKINIQDGHLPAFWISVESQNSWTVSAKNVEFRRELEIAKLSKQK